MSAMSPSNNMNNWSDSSFLSIFPARVNKILSPIPKCGLCFSDDYLSPCSLEIDNTPSASAEEKEMTNKILVDIQTLCYL
jgi:hypothetical protein